MQFIWTGENDLSKHTDAFYGGDPANSYFAGNISTRLRASVETLIEAGAPYVFVANIYPKHKAPVTTKYLCKDGSCVDTWGKVIQAANSAIKTQLDQSRYAKKIIYYDVFTFMVNVMNDKDHYGLTEPLTYYCDGDANAYWKECIEGQHTWQGAEKFYWMNFVQPTTVVHKLIAMDMKAAIDRYFGVK